MIRKALFAALFLSTGCAQVPMADPQADQIGRAFAPPEPGKGALYVYRSGVMGVARPIDVTIGGGPSAQLATNTYLRVEALPGTAQVTCKVGDKTGNGQVPIGEGSIRYVEVSMTVVSLQPGCEVAEVPPEQGQAAVRGGRRVAISP